MMGMFTSYFAFFHRLNFQAQVKTEKIDRLKKLTFTETEFKNIKWEEVNKEFQYKGKMYDVASIELSKDGYIIHCENDFMDDLLVGFLKSSEQKNKSKIPQLQLSEPVSIIQLPPRTLSLSSKGVFYQLDYSSFPLDSIYPPPRFS
jgi:hypothetical protein